jgi:hypothetical protein
LLKFKLAKRTSEIEGFIAELFTFRLLCGILTLPQSHLGSLSKIQVRSYSPWCQQHI